MRSLCKSERKVDLTRNLSESPSASVILNPVAGRGRGGREWPVVRSELEAAGVTWSLYETTGPGHAESIAASAIGGTLPDAIIVVGGDGTINEVVNGLVREAETGGVKQAAPGTSLAEGRQGTQSLTPIPPLGVIPVGHGNDLAKPLRLPVGDTCAAVNVVLRGKTRPLDLGRVNGRCFVNGVGIGFDGYAAVEVRRTRHLPGILMYVVAILRAFRTFQVTNVRVSYDGQSFERPITLVNVTNGPCHGGGFYICPHAVVDDGLLDVCVADGMSTLRLIPMAARASRGTHVGKDGISFAMAKHVTIECDRPLPSHVDGEILGEGLTRLDIDVLPAMLSVYAPA